MVKNRTARQNHYWRSSGLLRRRHLQRRARRGMTVFVVLMIISMLGAVGLFAARSATLGVSNAGRHRQMVQTHYIAEAGMQGAVAEFDRDSNQYITRLRNAVAVPTANSSTGQYPCQDIPFSTTASNFVPCSTVCLRIGYDAVQNYGLRGNPSASSFKLFNPKSLSTVDSTPVPGSFGMANIAGNFTVEFTDERPVSPPPAGMPVSGGGGTTLKYVSITARATGQVIPTDDDGNPLPVTGAGATFNFATSIETIRAEIVVPAI